MMPGCGDPCVKAMSLMHSDAIFGFRSEKREPLKMILKWLSGIGTSMMKAMHMTITQLLFMFVTCLRFENRLSLDCIPLSFKEATSFR